MFSLNMAFKKDKHPLKGLNEKDKDPLKKALQSNRKGLIEKGLLQRMGILKRKGYECPSKALTKRMTPRSPCKTVLNCSVLQTQA